MFVSKFTFINDFTVGFLWENKYISSNYYSRYKTSLYYILYDTLVVGKVDSIRLN